MTIICESHAKIDENGEEYEDNDARAIFYARGVLETVKKPDGVRTLFTVMAG